MNRCSAPKMKPVSIPLGPPFRPLSLFEYFPQKGKEKESLFIGEAYVLSCLLQNIRYVAITKNSPGVYPARREGSCGGRLIIRFLTAKSYTSFRISCSEWQSFLYTKPSNKVLLFLKSLFSTGTKDSSPPPAQLTKRMTPSGGGYNKSIDCHPERNTVEWGIWLCLHLPPQQSPKAPPEGELRGLFSH